MGEAASWTPVTYAAASWVLYEGQEVAIFRLDSCTFPTKEIMEISISILPLNSTKWGFLRPNVVFWAENFPTRKFFFSDSPKFTPLLVWQETVCAWFCISL